MPTTKIICPKCNTSTIHNITHEVEQTGWIGDPDIKWWLKSQIVTCRGCETVSFRQVSWNNEDRDFETGRPEEYEELFPPRVARVPIKDAPYLPTPIKEIYFETLKVADSGSPILASGGIRAVVEAICIDKSSKGRNLKEKIDALVTQGYLSRNQADFLHGLRFMGNAALHEIKPPEEEAIESALEIIDALLVTIYILPKKAKKLGIK